VTRIEVTPTDPVVTAIGSKQQVRVVAHYVDGTTRDVTHEAFVTSGNAEVAEVDQSALLTAVRRGEAPILARYEGAYAATTLTVMGQRDGFQWEQPPTWGPIDDMVATKWQRMKVLPSELSSDEEFLRRIYLDLTGLPPTSADIRAFLADDDADPRKTGRRDRPVARQRRLRRLLDQQVGRPVAGQSQVPRHRREQGVSRLDPPIGRREQAV
jgi:hypothetical protein